MADDKEDRVVSDEQIAQPLDQRAMKPLLRKIDL